MNQNMKDKLEQINEALITSQEHSETARLLLEQIDYILKSINPHSKYEVVSNDKVMQ